MNVWETKTINISFRLPASPPPPPPPTPPPPQKKNPEHLCKMFKQIQSNQTQIILNSADVLKYKQAKAKTFIKQAHL